jgi:uncharacterized repeat protein (TIGR03803 family)
MTLFSFAGKHDGGEPESGVVEDTEGNLFGTTAYGGTAQCNSGLGCGNIFEVTQSGKEKVLHVFTGTPMDGAGPAGPLLHSNGSYYGTTTGGGAFGCGTVFQLTVP